MSFHLKRPRFVLRPDRSGSDPGFKRGDRFVGKLFVGRHLEVFVFMPNRFEQAAFAWLCNDD